MLHSSFNYLSTATIQEYLDAAQVCLTSSNGNNDVYGMAALVLLCASMDAIGSYYKKDPNDNSKYVFDSNVDLSKVGSKVNEHFKAIYSEFFSNKQDFPEIASLDEGTFISLIYKSTRNKATHNAVIIDKLSYDNSKTVLYEADTNNNKILYINVLYGCVNNAFEMFRQMHPELTSQTTGNTAPSLTGATSNPPIQQTK